MDIQIDRQKYRQEQKKGDVDNGYNNSLPVILKRNTSNQKQKRRISGASVCNKKKNNKNMVLNWKLITLTLTLTIKNWI